MLEPGNNEALKIETVRRRTGLIRQYQSKGPVEIVAYMAAHALGFLRCCSNYQLAGILRCAPQLSSRDESSTRVEVCMRLQVARAIPSPE